MADQDEIHRKAASGEVKERREVVEQLRNNFASLPDKEQAWDDLIHLTRGKYNDVPQHAAYALGAVFFHIRIKEQAWNDLIRLAQDENHDVRMGAVRSLGVAFLHIPDKEQAWKDLIWLTRDKYNDVRRDVTRALGVAFLHLTDKELGWKCLHWLTQDEDGYVRQGGADALGAAFPHIPDKKQAWEDLHRLVQDKYYQVRVGAVRSIRTAFPHIPDKKQAWEDLHQLTRDRGSEVRWSAVCSLGAVFQHISDKEQAWKDLHHLMHNNDPFVRWQVAGALGAAFPHIPDNEQAWKDLHRLTLDNERCVRRGAANALGAAFPHIPDKEQVWADLHRLTQDKDGYVRQGGAGALGAAFPHITNKKKAWKDLHRLTRDEDHGVRMDAVYAIGTAFPHIANKKQAWEDLHRLTRDEDHGVRMDAVYAIGTAFPHIANKKQAWEDLYRLALGMDVDMWWRVAGVLDTIFSRITNRKQIFKDPHQMACWECREVRMAANHSLGQASIFKATKAESEDDFESELKNALEFFERSSKGATFFTNPSSFCLPFYRSFYTVTFERVGAEGEVQKCLAEAKSASEGSKNKELLLEAVDNLANALSEAHKVTDFDAMKSDLNTYRQYCDRAADLIGDAAEDAPGAAGILRRGMPIIGERIREIQKRAEALCRETRGTPLEELGLATYRSAQELDTQDPSEWVMALSNMASFARGLCEHLPPDKKVGACEQLNNLQLKNLTDRAAVEQFAALVSVLEYVQENTPIPKIQTVHVSETEQEIVKIAVVQISFELTESFPFVLENKDEVKTKVFSALEIAKQNGANIVCLPELCLCEEWISEIGKRCPDMIVIGGSFYKDNQNTCPVIMESDAVIPYQPKITPAVTEYDLIPGDGIYRYETRFGKFVILICTDFDDLAHYFREVDIDMIFCPSFNSANERFWNEAHSHVERTPSYILIANTGLHGGTSIFGQLDNKYFGKLADRGCKERKDPTYKLCEVKEGCEEVILADFNLIHKSVQKPTPSNRSKVIKSVDHIRKISIPQQS